jgi:phosphomannomutase
MKVSISGVRGIYGQDLNLHEVSRFAGQFAGIIKSGRCVIARDSRPSGRIISQTVASSLMSSGIDVYNLGIAPTPAVFREARKYGAGVVITASHNPLEWNGLKFIIEGRGLFESELAAMLKSPNSHKGKFGSEFDALSSYVDEVADLTKGAAVSVGIDGGGGAACGYSEKLFKKLGHKYYSINGTAGVSSRGPDPTADELADLRALVTSNHLDHGFALDLDGDRLVTVRSSGEKLNPDATLLLCIARAIDMGMKRFVTSIDTSIAIEKYIQDHSGKVTYSKVGEANVVSRMIEENADAGGEGSSAGFIMPNFNMCRDGLLAAATISTLEKKKMQECLEFASQYVQVRSKIPADSLLHNAVIEKLPDIFKQDSSSIMTEDGVKAIIDEDSWILVRPSNTEHAIRVSVESKSDRAQALYKKASEKVQAACDQVSRRALASG